MWGRWSGTPPTSTPLPPPPVQDQEEAHTLRIALEQVLDQLPEEDRELIFLRYTNQLPVGKIADILGVSRFAVYRREKQILKQLRSQLDGREFYA